MNLQDLIRRVQRSYGDSAEAQVFVTDIIDWVNDAQLVLNRELELLTSSATLTVDATTAVSGWSLPADYVKSTLVQFLTTPLTYSPYQDVKKYLNTNTPPADPSWYYIWGNKLYCFPRPVTYGANVVHNYVRMPATLKATGDTPELPAIYHLDLVRYCLARAKELNEDEQAVNRINQEWVAMVANSKFNNYPNENNYPVVRDYVGDYW